MRLLSLAVAMLVAILVAVMSHLWVGVSLGLAVLMFQFVLSYGRSQASLAVINTPARGVLSDLVRNGVFLIPLILSIVARSWLGLAGVIISYLLSIEGMSRSLGKRD